MVNTNDSRHGSPIKWIATIINLFIVPVHYWFRVSEKVLLMQCWPSPDGIHTTNVSKVHNFNYTANQPIRTSYFLQVEQYKSLLFSKLHKMF